MQIKVNKKYRLTKDYLDFLTIKPQGEYVEIKMIYGNTVVFSDGISQFTDTVTNLIPNLLEPITTFNTKSFLKQEQKKDSVVVEETPIIDAPVEEPVTPTAPVEEPVQPSEPVFDPNNPYGDSYI